MKKIFESAQEVVQEIVTITTTLTNIGHDIISGIYYTGGEDASREVSREVIKDLCGEFDQLIKDLSSIRRCVSKGIVTSEKKFEPTYTIKE